MPYLLYYKLSEDFNYSGMRLGKIQKNPCLVRFMARDTVPHTTAHRYMIPISEEINQNGGIPGWLELYDLSLHGDMEARMPSGAYIKGIIKEGELFSPTSKILGKAIPKPENIGQNSGWVELETRRFHSDIEAVAPRPPYVHGLRDREDHFYPDEPYEIISL